MDTPLWIGLILLAVIIAGGIYMLTRNPAPKRSDGPPPEDSPQGVDPNVDEYDVGGSHVAAGDAQAGASVPYDQEVDSRADEYEHDGETHLEPSTVDETVSQDTATGAEIEIVEEEPVIRSTEDLDPVDAPADPYDHGDQEQMTYGAEQTEDYASETTYATPAPLHADTSDDDLDGRSANELMGASGEEEIGTQRAPYYGTHDAGSDQGSTGGATLMDREGHDDDSDVSTQGAPYYGQHSVDGDGDGDPDGLDDHHQLHHGDPVEADGSDSHDAGTQGAPYYGQHSVGADDEHHGAGSENLGPEEGEGDADEDEVDQGHPGPISQPGDDAGYADPDTDDEAVENLGPEEGEGDETPEDDQGHPGPDSHPAGEATYDDAPDDEHSESETFVDSHDSDRVVDGSRDGDDDVVVVEEVIVVEEDDAHDSGEHHDHEAAREGDELAGEDDVVVEEVVVVEDDNAHDAPVALTDSDDGDDHAVESGHHGDGKGQVATDGDTDQEAQMVDVDDFSGATSPETGTHDHDTDGHDDGDHDSSDHDHNTVQDHDHEGGEHHDHDHSAGEHHDHEGHDGHQVGTVDLDDDAGGSAATASGAGLEDQQATEAMVDRENEQPVDADADAERQPDGAGAEEPARAEADETVSEEGPYGPGSAMPTDDGSGPSGFGIKGNAGSMLFHTEDSPAYEDCRAEVWFKSDEDAREAGFAHWDRKRR
ncbi:MAG: hypothetical protein WBG57_09275 [Ornithinimicrobium sp.]